MQKPVDAFGTELSTGEFITYVVRNSISIDIRAGIICEILDAGEESWNRYSIRIISYSTQHRYVSGKGYIPGIYKTKLTSNDTLVVVGSFPRDIATVLNNAYLGKDIK